MKNNQCAAVVIGNGVSSLYSIRAAVGIGKCPILIIFQGDNYKPKYQ
jgi:hypothetical protein